MIYLLSTASAGPGQEDNLEKGVGVRVVTLKYQANELHMSCVREHTHISTNITHLFHTYYKQISVQKDAGHAKLAKGIGLGKLTI